MKTTLRKTGLALAVIGFVASPAAFAQDDQNVSANIYHEHIVLEDWDITVDDTRNTTVNNLTTDVNLDVDADVDADVDLVLDAAAVIRYNDTTNNVTNNTDNTLVDTTTTTTTTTTDTSTTTYNSDENYLVDEATFSTDTSTTNFTSDTVEESFTSDSSTTTFSSDVVDNSWSNEVYENIDRTEVVNSDVRREGNSHQVSVSLEKDLSLSSDIDFTGAPEITGAIDIDSAAIAVVDGRQSTSGNVGFNDMLENDATLDGDVASTASGNLGFNVGAGDNNSQDNAAALSAADASFAFGMADAEVFNSQQGFANDTINAGVANTAGLDGNAFSGASGNIHVNVASGNNNAQRNSLAASVATSAYAQSSISSNQISQDNIVDNTGSTMTVEDTLTLDFGGTVGAGDNGATASYSGTGASYQMAHYYPEIWEGITHPEGDEVGHSDWDNDVQGAVDNPYRDGVGGIAFDNDEEGVIDLSDVELVASLSGTLDYSYDVAVAATNSASLTGAAFSNASGNIGVNVSAGTGNLQSNSLALAVAQPTTGGGGGGGEVD